MIRNFISFTAFTLTMFLISCAPQSGNNTANPNNDQVTEQAINSLTANVWCQLNATTGTSDYRWAFDKKFKVVSKDLSTQNEQAFTWNINGSSRILSVYISSTSLLFAKQISYNYNVDKHKRTMRWTDVTTEVTNFIECD